MFAATTPLKSLSSVELSAEESSVLSWVRAAVWEPVDGGKMRAKVPEFFGGVRLYRMQAGAGKDALEMFIKKLGFQGVIRKQDLYPVFALAGARYVMLSKEELAHLGVGQDDDED